MKLGLALGFILVHESEAAQWGADGENEMITADTVLAEIETLAEAKAIAADMRKTVATLEVAYGADHSTAKIFSDRYFAFVDAMAEKFA